MKVDELGLNVKEKRPEGRFLDVHLD